MKMSAKGVPILSMHEKVMALAHCIARDQHEDACGHLCDLLAHQGKRIKPDSGIPFQNLQEIVARYGSNPTPIDDDPH